MDAADELLQHKSFRSISIREIAAAADMKSAMIGYYFGAKEGLFVALLERLAQQQFERSQLAKQAENLLKEFIRTAVCYFSQNRAVIRLIADEVLFQKSTISDRFIELFQKRMAGRTRPGLPLHWQLTKDSSRATCGSDGQPVAMQAVPSKPSASGMELTDRHHSRADALGDQSTLASPDCASHVQATK